MTDQPNVEITEEKRGKAALYAKIAAVTGEMRTIPKDKEHPTQHWKYSSWDAVAQVLNAALGKYKLAIIPGMPREMPEKENVGKTSNGAAIWRTNVMIEFTLACGDTGETEVRSWWGYADDSSDKGLDKAATYCEKSFMKKLFVISTGDEIEAEQRSHTEEAGYQPPPLQEVKRERKPAASKTEKPSSNGAMDLAVQEGKTLANFGAAVKELGFGRASMTATFNHFDVPKDKDGKVTDIEQNYDLLIGALTSWKALSDSLQPYTSDKKPPKIENIAKWAGYMGIGASPWKPEAFKPLAEQHDQYRAFRAETAKIIPDADEVRKLLEDLKLVPWRPEKQELMLNALKSHVQAQAITDEIVEQGTGIEALVGGLDGAEVSDIEDDEEDISESSGEPDPFADDLFDSMFPSVSKQL